MEVIDKQQSEIAVYQPFYAQLSELEKNNTALAFDYESKIGNKQARSHIYTLRQTKGALEKVRKEAKAESLRIGRAVDSEAAQIETRIEAMIVVHQAKIDEIEKREADRVAAQKEKLGVLAQIHEGRSVEEYKFHLATLEAVVINDKWEEFELEAAKTKEASIAKHRELLAAKEKANADALELERLRKEAEDRAQKDRDEAIAKAAAEKAVAEAKAKADVESAKQRQAVEDAELRARQEREAGERRELELKLQAEQAERRRIEVEQKAAQDAKDALAKAEQDRLDAIEAERKRVADVVMQEQIEAVRREKDKAHMRKINQEALAGFIAGGVSEEIAKKCISLIAQKKIQNIVINY